MKYIQAQKAIVLTNPAFWNTSIWFLVENDSSEGVWFQLVVYY